MIRCGGAQSEWSAEWVRGLPRGRHPGQGHLGNTAEHLVAYGAHRQVEGQEEVLVVTLHSLVDDGHRERNGEPDDERADQVVAGLLEPLQCGTEFRGNGVQIGVAACDHAAHLCAEHSYAIEHRDQLLALVRQHGQGGFQVVDALRHGRTLIGQRGAELAERIDGAADVITLLV